MSLPPRLRQPMATASTVKNTPPLSSWPECILESGSDSHADKYRIAAGKFQDSKSERAKDGAPGGRVQAGVGFAAWRFAGCGGSVGGDVMSKEIKHYGKCIAGTAKSGDCGAAACCATAYACCAACPEDCNSRCGWLDEANDDGGTKNAEVHE